VLCSTTYDNALPAQQKKYWALFVVVAAAFVTPLGFLQVLLF
jgi:hypothetical protein